MHPTYVALYEVTWLGAWLCGVPRTCRDSNSLEWHHPCKNQTALQLHHLGGYSKRVVKSYSHSFRVSCFECGLLERSFSARYRWEMCCCSWAFCWCFWLALVSPTTSTSFLNRLLTGTCWSTSSTFLTSRSSVNSFSTVWKVINYVFTAICNIVQ